MINVPDSKVHGTNMGPIWDWQDPGGPINFAIWGVFKIIYSIVNLHTFPANTQNCIDNY